LASEKERIEAEDGKKGQQEKRGKKVEKSEKLKERRLELIKKRHRKLKKKKRDLEWALENFERPDAEGAEDVLGIDVIEEENRL
jgi:hypothetical protein